MDSMTIIAIISIVTAGLTMAIGSIGPAFGEARAVSSALTALAQQPDASSTITRTLFVGLFLLIGLTQRINFWLFMFLGLYSSLSAWSMRRYP